MNNPTKWSIFHALGNNGSMPQNQVAAPRQIKSSWSGMGQSFWQTLWRQTESTSRFISGENQIFLCVLASGVCLSVCPSVCPSVGENDILCRDGAERSGPELSGAEQSWAEQSRAELSGAERSIVERSIVERSRAEHSGAEQSEQSEQSGAVTYIWPCLIVRTVHYLFATNPDEVKDRKKRT